MLETAPTDSPTISPSISRSITSRGTTSSLSSQTTLSSSSTQSSSSTSSTTPSTCASFDYPTSIPSSDAGEEENDGDVNTNGRKRSVAGRISLLEKRAAKAKPCPGPTWCKLKTKAKPPNYPLPSELAQYSRATSWYITSKGPGCGAWNYTRHTGDPLTAKNAKGDTCSYAQGAETDKSDKLNADHVYELKILKDFFAEDVSEETCSPWKSFWETENTQSFNYDTGIGKNFYNPSQNSGWTRMQTMFKLLPGMSNGAWADFAGMDDEINEINGKYVFFSSLRA